jgi:hypothetical protein
MTADSPPRDPFERFLLWLRDLLHAVRVRIDALITRIVLTLTPGTGV